MSYILDALRRADSERERERGGVPGINAQPVPIGTLEAGTARRNRVGLWVVAGVLLGLAVPVAWRLAGSGDEAPEAAAAPGVGVPVSGQVGVAAPVPPAAPAAPRTAALPTPEAAGSPGTPAPAEATAAPGSVAAAPPSVQDRAASRASPRAPTPTAAATRPPTSTTPPAPSGAMPAPRRAAAPAPEAGPARTDLRGGAALAAPPTPTPGLPPAPAVATTAPSTGPTAAATAAPRAAAPAPAPPPPLPRLAELPDELRREVPALAFGGSVYSELPNQRMVIFNGLLLREGESITTELAVDEIRPKSTVLRIRGRRFEHVY